MAADSAAALLLRTPNNRNLYYINGPHIINIFTYFTTQRAITSSQSEPQNWNIKT